MDKAIHNLKNVLLTAVLVVVLIFAVPIALGAILAIIANLLVLIVIGVVIFLIVKLRRRWAPRDRDAGEVTIEESRMDKMRRSQFGQRIAEWLQEKGQHAKPPSGPGGRSEPEN